MKDIPIKKLLIDYSKIIYLTKLLYGEHNK